ncbi:MAG: hypothetical protein C0501_23335 [Isosphaera sp.]|nr:hypothetical protein [Isosphaera sp.]
MGAAAVGIGTAVWLSAAPARLSVEVGPPPKSGGSSAGTPDLVGVTGCLAAACHGSPGTDALAGTWGPATWQSSGTCWMAADPHRGAYALLEATQDTPRRRPDRPTAWEITELLGQKRADGKKLEAYEDVRCLACHTTPALAHPDVDRDTDDAVERARRQRMRGLRADGVGCEACHGAAKDWVVPHTAWKGRDGHAELFTKYGMTPLYDVGERATTCVGCHVGAPASPGVPVRDMNHDMIAAGHPALNFDFGEYHRRLPKHWYERARVGGHDNAGPGSEARRWLVGRVAHAEAACRLLADRAARPVTDERSPWPEFAEFNCATCHHHLRGEGPTARPGVRGQMVWQPVWPATGEFGPNPGVAQAPQLDKLRDLVRVMGTRNKFPGRGVVGEPALAAADQLRQERLTLVKAPAVEVTARAKNAFPKLDGKPTDWDPVGQVLLGLAALERDRDPGKPPKPGFDPAFDAVRGHRDWPAALKTLAPLLP